MSDNSKRSQPSSSSDKSLDDDLQVCSAPLAIDSARLFANKKEVWISHSGERYRLQITRAGKLILTK